MIILYQYEISPFCDKVRRVLHLKKQPYQVREVSLMETARGFNRRVSAAGKLPAIEHDGTKIGDSTDIVAYLERTFPDPPVYPSEPRQRALAHVLEDWADESLYFYEMYLRFQLPHNAARWVPELTKRDGRLIRGLAPKLAPRAIRKRLRNQGLGIKAPERVVDEVKTHLAALEGLLGEADWLVGDALSIADIAVFAQLFCIRGAGEGARAMETRPAVAAWMERVDRATAAPM